MMSALPIPRINPQEFLRRERLAEFKSEYHRGEIVAMSGASRVHCRILSNVNRILGNQLLDGPCNNYSNDMRVSIRGGRSYFYPDIVVTCGKEEYIDNQFDTLLNPIVVIEILSASTEGYDRGRKFLDYQEIPSLQEYVLISQKPRRFEIYRRQQDGTWVYQSWAFTPPPLVLQSINCTLAPEDVYDKVEVEGEGESGEEPQDDERRLD